jgi:hypothetical protein
MSAGDKLVYGYGVDPKMQALNRVPFHSTLDGDTIDGTVEFKNAGPGTRRGRRLPRRPRS